MTRFALFLAAVLAVAVPLAAQSSEGVVVGIGNSLQGPPLSGPVYGLAIAPDGEVWARGQFGQRAPDAYDSIAHWDGEGWRGTAVFHGYVNTLAVDATGAAYVGGSFARIGDAPIVGIARWSGEAWEDLGTGVGDGGTGMGGAVNTILPVTDGSVVVGGGFSRAGSTAVANVARWTGATWESVGGGLGGIVQTLSEGTGGVLYAGGARLDGPVAGEPVRGVMRWDGSAWTSLGDVTLHGTPSGRVTQVLATPDGRLFARGDFDAISGVAARGLAQWADGVWTPLGQDLYETSALTLGADGEVWAVGTRRDAPGFYSTRFLLRWTGAEWAEVAGPITGSGSYFTLAAAPDGSFVLGGNFDPIGAIGAEFAVRWAGANWQSLGSHVNRQVAHIALAPGGGAYFAGEFTTVPFGDAFHIAEWTGGVWSTLGAGLPAAPSDIAVGPDGALYAGGSFYFYDADGNSTLVPAMRWDGHAWTPMRDPARSLAAGALTVWNGAVYITAFNPGSGRYGVFRWAGTQWSQTGGLLDGYINVLGVSPDGSLYVGGAFRVSDTSEPAVLARWAETGWDPVRGVFDSWESLQTLASGADGRFYASGSRPGGSVLARRGAAGWDALNSPPLGPVLALTATADGRIYAGGVTYGSPSPLFVWDGESWESAAAIQSDEYGNVAALAVLDSGELLLGGQFPELSGVRTSNVALYQPAVMDASETPTAPLVRSMTVAPNPAHGAARLTATVPAGMAEVSVYDTLGRRLSVAFDGETTGALSVPLDLAGLAPGVYVVRVRAADGVETARFTVAR